jgi:hypothetical protein
MTENCRSSPIYSSSVVYPQSHVDPRISSTIRKEASYARVRLGNLIAQTYMRSTLSFPRGV